MIWLVNAHYIRDYKVFVHFNDGKQGEVNLECYIN